MRSDVKSQDVTLCRTPACHAEAAKWAKPPLPTTQNLQNQPCHAETVTFLQIREICGPTPVKIMSMRKDRMVE